MASGSSREPSIMAKFAQSAKIHPWLRQEYVGSFFHALATYDVFPDFSARARRLLYNPLGVLVLAAITALACGLFLHPQGFVLCGGIVAVIVLGVCWPWLTARGLSGRLSFDRARATEGERVEARLALRNRLPWRTLGLVVRGGFVRRTDDTPETPAACIASLPRRQTSHCRWPFVPACRGVYPLAPPCLATGFPFGLWENRTSVITETPLIVWPRTYPVGPLPLVCGQQQVEGNVSRNKVGSNGDVLGVRPYRRGDSPRRIHWGQSARHDRLIVCELHANSRPVVQLVLDADPAVHVGTGADGSREWAIRVVASLAKGWLEAGAQVEVVWNDQVIRAASGTKQIHEILDRLARLPDAAPPLADVLRHPACRDFRDGLQIVVTTNLGLTRLTRQATGQEQRWVVLRSSAFGEAAPLDLPVRPWLDLDRIDRIPHLLRGGWKEARHGT